MKWKRRRRRGRRTVKWTKGWGRDEADGRKKGEEAGAGRGEEEEEEKVELKEEVLMSPTPCQYCAAPADACVALSRRRPGTHDVASDAGAAVPCRCTEPERVLPLCAAD